MIINEVDVSIKVNLFADNTKVLAILVQFEKSLDTIYFWLEKEY